MHSEDYVHRIGRTGRAHAVGDAISFVTPEDHGELRALERFIGRGIVRKKADGFNYAASAPHSDASPQHRHDRRGPAPLPHPRPARAGGSRHDRPDHSGTRSHGQHRRFGSR
jgi:ATP-dependent RNA helicase RhlE